MRIIEALLIAGIIATFILLGAVIYRDLKAEKMSLTKSEWTCTKHHKQTILVGKVPVVKTVCDNYERLQ